ncbi:MAG: hypothetical protein RLZZ292_1832 [Bacteroidota bacterium]|jgi:hypothetical protein
MSKPIIGIISEHPYNDGKPIVDLLERYFPEKAEYIPLLTTYRGSALGNGAFYADLETQFEENDCDFVLIIQDLDDDKNLKKRHTFFEKCKTLTNDKAQFLLFKYMIEALAITDFDTTEQHYNKKVKNADRPSNSKSAKEKLKILFAYTESDMRVLAKKFDTKILTDNYSVWRDFIQVFGDSLL